MLRNFRLWKIMLYFTVIHKWIGRTPKITLNYIKGTKTAVSIFIFFFYLSFISQTLTIHRTVGEEGGYLFNSYIPILFLSQKLTLSHQLDPDRELLFLKHQLLTTKTRPWVLLFLTHAFSIIFPFTQHSYLLLSFHILSYNYRRHFHSHHHSLLVYNSPTNILMS